MTFAIFIFAFVSLFFLILNLLPVGTPLAPEVATGIATIISQMKAWDEVFPIQELLAAVGILAGYFFLYFGWRIVKWVIHIVRGGAT